MNDSRNGRVPILLWPFYAIWRLLTFVVELIGRLLCGVLGIGLMVAGVAITLSIIGVPVGIPLASIGFLLLARSIF
jgi:small-conductance mechanosensitive channel